MGTICKGRLVHRQREEQTGNGGSQSTCYTSSSLLPTFNTWLNNTRSKKNWLDKNQLPRHCVPEQSAPKWQLRTRMHSACCITVYFTTYNMKIEPKLSKRLESQARTTATRRTHLSLQSSSSQATKWIVELLQPLRVYICFLNPIHRAGRGRWTAGICL